MLGTSTRVLHMHTHGLVCMSTTMAPAAAGLQHPGTSAAASGPHSPRLAVGQTLAAQVRVCCGHLVAPCGFAACHLHSVQAVLVTCRASKAHILDPAAGVLENTAEMKLSQLRLGALDALAAILSSTQVGPTTVPQPPSLMLPRQAEGTHAKQA